MKKGTIAWLEYEGWIVHPDGTEKLWETTKEDLAKEHDIHDEKKRYGEEAVVIGAGRLMAGLDEALLKAKVGKGGEVVVPPEKGAGERDPKLVELRSAREFLRQDITPEVGLEVTVSGRRGHITAVTAGRVRVDFNNPLAGKTIRYRYKITRLARTVKDKVRGVIELDYGSAEDFEIATKGKGAVDIVIPDICKTDEHWFVHKFRVVADLREHAGLHTIRFIEEYEKEEAPEPEAAEEAAPVEEGEGTPEEEERVPEELPPEEKVPEEL
jgi:FKBP-type peptidyl-prolyl cis-trans isomerase 2